MHTKIILLGLAFGLKVIPSKKIFFKGRVLKLLEQYKQYLAAKYKKNTASAYISSVNNYAHWLKGVEPEELLKYMVLQLNDYLVVLAEKYPANTFDLKKNRLLYFFEWIMDNNFLPSDLPPERIKKLAYIIGGKNLPRPKRELKGVLKEYADWLHMLSINTKNNNISHVKQFMDWLESHLNEPFQPDNITSSIIKTYKEHLTKEKFPGRNKYYTPGTINTKLMAVMSFCEFALDKRYLVTNPAKRIRDLLATEVTNLEDKWLTPLEQSRLIYKLEKEPDNILDIALVLILLDAGLRASEVVALNVEDVTLYPVNQAFIHVRDSKRNKSRTIPIKFIEKKARDKVKYVGGRLHETLRKYLDHRQQIYVSDDVALFLNRGKRITYQFLKRRVKYYGKLIGIGKLTPHSLRHSFCKNLIDQGVRDVEVALLAGHTKKNGDPNLQMVARYTKPGVKELQRAVNQLPE